MYLSHVQQLHRKLIKISVLGHQPKYHISKASLLKLTSSLLKQQSEKLDRLCEETLRNYCKANSEFNQMYQRKEWEMMMLEQSGNEEKIKILYCEASDALVGFLKGDIHSQLIYNMNRYLQKKPQNDQTKQLSHSQYHLLLNEITEIKNFRLPKKQLGPRQYQDQLNLFKRQLIIESISHQQSTENYYDVLDNLIKIDRIHLKHVFSDYMSQWFKPLCIAIREEQDKCKKNDDILSRRKKYAQYLISLCPQKLTLVCLNQLLRLIANILYKNHKHLEYDQIFFKWFQLKTSQLDEIAIPELEQYDQIRVKTFSQLLAKLITIQLEYQQKQQKFKMVMKLYDAVRQSYKCQKKFEQEVKKQKQQQKNMEQIINQIQNNINRFKDQNREIDQQQIKKLQNFQYFNKLSQIRKIYGQKYIRPNERKQFLQELAIKLLSEHRFQTDIPKQTQLQIGCLLMLLIKQNLKIRTPQGKKIPLLSTQFKYIQKQGQLYLDERYRINHYFLQEILPKIQKQSDLFLHLEHSVPTIIQPLPWMQYRVGGYYLNPSILMRFSDLQLQERLVRYSDQNRIFQVLNFLGKTSWKINNKVLHVVETIWGEGGGFGEIPKRFSQMIARYLVQLKQQPNQTKKLPLMKKILRIRDEHSLRCDFNLKLAIAKAFSKLDKFYYPHNLDFRGRVYPISPHFNHIGNDLARGLLLFGNGVKLGKNGLKWLKIHCANLMGKDKYPLHEKIQFIQSSMGLITEIASDPLKNREWLTYEDCWQALGAIIQLYDAISSENPQQFISHMHIHQDGSCNGLQHYAALGRDIEGANQVNLAPTQKPGDVYSHVAKMVTMMVQKDLINPSSQFHLIATKVNGQIKRKTIKQTVMTSVYGVTFIGARKQIQRQIKDQNFLDDQGEKHNVSKYLARYTLEAISNLFSSAHQIKKWLLQCAKIVANQGNPMGWVTPMGLPVVQPYRASYGEGDSISIVSQKLQLIDLPINKSKQQSAFPPNYIHSLDSTHMMYTALRCMNSGIVFAAVHDSYWTHAGTVEQMNTFLREQFIKLHSEPLLQNLKKSLEQRYPMINFPEIPKRGQFSLQAIKSSAYFFA